jgi:outer membrane protein OmpA-like peptidoglycan-associated protein
MRRALLVFSAVFAGSCATGAALQLDLETLETRLDAARESDAYRCAPKELAEAETQLEFMQVELDQGNSLRAGDHRDRARAALVAVIDKVKVCPPLTQDRDKDGIPDDKDACPDIPGPEKFLGCPDRDGDEIADNVDRCPDVPEDRDGNADEDGCPEEEDRDGDGILDQKDECPDVPGPIENKGCPIKDRDRDGILDDTDKCPDDPEDKDNYQDEDGCPDKDNDGDGIPDVSDKCPDLPETRNNFQDDDGCPDINPDLVVVNRDLGKIEIKQKVFFDTAKWTIKPVSFKLLNEVGEALKANPTMEVLVEGHTDSQGSDAMNLKLSQNRANSVREYLVAQGIESSRLTSIGFGETKPIDDNATAAGRERNRRVEFTIVKE